jgi:hypothetical protein
LIIIAPGSTTVRDSAGNVVFFFLAVVWHAHNSVLTMAPTFFFRIRSLVGQALVGPT